MSVIVMNVSDDDDEVERIARLMHSAFRVHFEEHPYRLKNEEECQAKPFDDLLPRIQEAYRAVARAVIADRVKAGAA